MLRFLDIPMDNLSLCLTALKEDSQKGTPVSRDSKSKSGVLTWTDETIARCNADLTEAALPKFGTKFKFNNDLETVPL